LTLFAAARRAFSRQLDDSDEILAAAFFCTGWHATAAYKIRAPLARCTVVLGLDAATAAGFISTYKMTEAREPIKCARAKAEFVDFYQQLTGEDLSELNI
jgi:hypothetical protein